MQSKRMVAGIVPGICLCLATTTAFPAEVNQPHQVTPNAIRASIAQQNPQANVYAHRGRVQSVYGTTLSGGASPEAAAQTFCEQYAGLFGVSLDELTPGARHLDAGEQSIGTVYNPEDDSYRFTIVYYTQQRDGIAVFDSRMTLLVRNEPGYPLVMAKPHVRALGDFHVDAKLAQQPAPNVNQLLNGRFAGGEIIESDMVIFAGAEDMTAPPTLAHRLMIVDGFDEWLIVVDAQTGQLLHQQYLVHFDTTGNAQGLATEGIGAMQCEAETPMPVPHLEVGDGVVTTFTDADGNFTFPGDSGATITASLLDGQWFQVFNHATFPPADDVLTASAPFEEGAELVFNEANASDLDRAQINGYIEANRTRDWALSFNPNFGDKTFPDLNVDDFEVNVNRTDGFCPGNAWYSSAEITINFCQGGSSNANTAFASVIMHEYGHHLVNAGGSGQGEYGEGMSDTVSALMLESPLLALGFFGNCVDELRNADNNCQFLENGCSTCGSAIHPCGQLLSGCVWDTLQAMQAAGIEDALDVVSNLAVNSILLHEGSSITPEITIDFLMLDDDDADLSNGTPHAEQIIAGFDQHSMVEFAVDVDFASALPDAISPAGGDTIDFTVGSQVPFAGELNVDFLVDTGNGFESQPVEQVGEDTYQATFPPSECGTLVDYYFAVSTTSGAEATFPEDAPNVVLSAVSATSFIASFDDDFEQDLGWQVENAPGLTDGAWELGVPAGGGDRGDPPNDADGSGQCYVTDNADGNNDVDDGATTLISPVLNADIENPTLRYFRWFSNTEGDAPFQDVFVVEISDDGGATWMTLEEVGPGGSEVDGGWFFKEFALNEIEGLTLNDQFRVRFTAEDAEPGSVVEAGVDGVQIVSVGCDDPADLNGDGAVNTADLLQLLGAWGPCDACIEDINGDGEVGTDDLLQLLSAWEVG